MKEVAVSRGEDEGKSVLRRLKRVEGQIRGISRMVDEGKPCEEVLMQVAAARAALDQVGIHIISQRIRECLQEQGLSDEESVRQAIGMFLRYSSSFSKA